MRRRGSSVRHRLVAEMSAMVIAHLLLLGAIATLVGAFRLTEQVKHRLTDEAGAVLGRLETRLRHFVEVTEHFATSSHVTNSLIDEAGRAGYLPAAVRDLTRPEAVGSVVVLDFAGRVIEQSGEPLFQVSAQGLRSVLIHGHTKVDFDPKHGAIRIIAPVIYYGSPQGSVVVEINASTLAKNSFPDSLHHYKLSLVGGWGFEQNVSDSELLSSEWIAGSKQALLAQFGARLSAGLPKWDALRPVLSSLWETLIIGALVVGLSIWRAFRVGRRLAAPIRLLTDKVRSGELCAPMGASDEIDELAQMFDAKTRSLLDAKLDLEDRVKARTLELERQTEELQRSNSDLEQFAYVASHDLQEPLRMVSSYTQLMEERMDGTLDQKTQRHMKHIREGALRMQELVSDLLKYSRAGVSAKEMEAIKLEEVIGRALANLQVSVKEAEAEVTQEALPVVRGDKVQLTQTFQNLIGNAIKFRGADAPRIHVSACREDSGDWRIGVHDNGIGIAPEYYERIFVIFQRLHQRKDYSGTGIGLSITKKVIERHGGKIWVDSKPGVGSSFYVSLCEGFEKQGFSDSGSASSQT